MFRMITGLQEEEEPEKLPRSRWERLQVPSWVRWSHRNWECHIGIFWGYPSGKHTKNYGKSPFLMGKFTMNGDFP